mgnify:FL=1
MKYSSQKVRNDFIDFFTNKLHKFVRSSPVLPSDDPTLLFTNAGMNQFKDIFLSKKVSSYKRAVNSQKCIRVSGKHNDLEEVGVDLYHHTFFEMLGNWSFGDYYKKEAIQWSWELLTDIWKLDKKRLWVTIYKDDDESAKIWQEFTDIDSSRILKFGDKENFWEMGDTGPCGPCSEIHYYIGDLNKQSKDGVNKTDEYRELWNLVFMQFNRNENGQLEDLDQKHVDTGLGLERMVSTLNKLDDHYKTDLFYPIIEKIIKISNKDYTFNQGTPHRVIADHLRMISFSISDGVMPSNEGRGYVVRRVLRRAARFGRVLGINKSFLYLLYDSLLDILGESYPELVDKKDYVVKVIKSEEESFGKTLDRGLVIFEEICDNLKDKIISGEDVFRLYDTYGFPVDLTELLAKEQKLKIDKDNFSLLMEKQRTKAREANKFKLGNKKIDWIFLNDIGTSSSFIGYDCDESNSMIIKYRESEGSFEIVLDQTPFYAESGGQIGDVGVIKGDDFKFIVSDTYKHGDDICHFGSFENGNILQAKKEKVVAKINQNRRKSIQLNHTGTHLLHKALKIVLGNDVQQAGSLVSYNHLRFDLTYYKKIKSSELDKIEDIVNEIILNNISLDVNIKKYSDAKSDGAEALFGEKYGDEVRVVNINGFSKELCGGTHVKNTSEIGLFKIISESSLASGVRRIEALTGQYAFSYFREKSNLLSKIRNTLMCNEEDMLNKIENLTLLNKKYKKEIENLNIKESKSIIKESVQNNKVEVNNVFVYSDVLNIDIQPNILSDLIRDNMKTKGIGLVSTNLNGDNIIVCTITKDLDLSISAGNIIKKLAEEVNLKGGGSNYMAMLKLSNNYSFKDALKKGLDIIRGII